MELVEDVDGNRVSLAEELSFGEASIHHLGLHESSPRIWQAYVQLPGCVCIGALAEVQLACCRLTAVAAVSFLLAVREKTMVHE